MSVREKNRQALRVKLDEIKESGYHLSCSRSKNWVSEIFKDLADSDFTFIDDIEIQVEIFKFEKDISVSGLIRTAIKMSCIRCLGDFEFPLEADFHYNLFPAEERELSPEIEVSKQDLDEIYYQGDSIEIPPLIREQVLLNVPSRPLCQELCKGICSKCGSNLNQAPCQCEREEGVVSKFEALRNFPLKK
jgi:uncharacterized protein